MILEYIRTAESLLKNTPEYLAQPFTIFYFEDWATVKEVQEKKLDRPFAIIFSDQFSMTYLSPGCMPASGTIGIYITDDVKAVGPLKRTQAEEEWIEFTTWLDNILTGIAGLAGNNTTFEDLIGPRRVRVEGPIRTPRAHETPENAYYEAKIYIEPTGQVS